MVFRWNTLQFYKEKEDNLLVCIYFILPEFEMLGNNTANILMAE